MLSVTARETTNYTTTKLLKVNKARNGSFGRMRPTPCKACSAESFLPLFVDANGDHAKLQLAGCGIFTPLLGRDEAETVQEDALDTIEREMRRPRDLASTCSSSLRSTVLVMALFVPSTLRNSSSPSLVFD